MLFRYHFETAARPEQVFGAFTDFSDRRLEVWQRTLDPAKYAVLERGTTWAVAREGSAGTDIWVLLRYEWQEPGTIRWTLVDSSYCSGGRGEVVVVPREGGGSRVDVLFDHSGPRGVKGAAILLAQRLVGPVAFPRLWRASLDRLAC